MEKRLLGAGGLVGIGLLLVFFRLLQLIVVQGEELARQAEGQHWQRTTLIPRRGAIVDRNGEPLALSIPAEALYVRPRKTPADVKTQTPTLASTLQISQQTVDHALSSPAPFVWLKRQATLQEAAQVRALGIPGIDSIETQRRFYPQGTLAAPLLGFTNIDAQGLEGVERAYDRYLRGEPAEIVGERDAFGRTILAQGGEVPPKALNVRLTLDAGLQYLAERELERTVRETKAQAGTAIILDPQTFAVLALAQVPTFDPNAPGQSPVAARRNRAVSDCYEPGSTLKGLLAAAALDANVVRPEEQIFCELGKYPVGKHTINDHHAYGWLTFTEVLQKSSNIGAAKVGERLGKESYSSYLRAFGFGRVTAIDLPGEIPGILSSSSAWARINLVTISFGQGIAVTPLQLACAYAALANDGVLMRPYIVREVFDADGKVVMANSPQRLWQVVRTDTAHQVLRMLEKVVEQGGTGRRARIGGVRIAGKTGTSQKIDPRGGYSARGRIASFVGIVPADQPRLVILITIDEPRTGVYGGEIAAPVFQAIAQQALVQLGIQANPSFVERLERTVPPTPTTPSRRQPRLRSIASTEITAPVAAAELSEEPNFLGMSLREAMVTAQRKNLRLSTAGRGYVVNQTTQHLPDTEELVYVLTFAPTGEVQP
jgi:cell division protein FtsI (penicillin-binding protein 3)